MLGEHLWSYRRIQGRERNTLGVTGEGGPSGIENDAPVLSCLFLPCSQEPLDYFMKDRDENPHCILSLLLFREKLLLTSFQAHLGNFRCFTTPCCDHFCQARLEILGKQEKGEEGSNAVSEQAICNNYILHNM